MLSAMVMSTAADGHRERNEQTTAGSERDDRREQDGGGKAIHECL